MSLAVFYASALIWAFLCVLVAVVAGAAAGGRPRHWKTALVGLLVGAAFGLVTGVLFSFVAAMTVFPISLLPALLHSLAIYFTPIALSVAAAGVAGLAVGLLERRSAAIVRRCLIVGVAFGLVLGIANAALAPVWMNALIPVLEAVGIGRWSAPSIGVAIMVSGVIMDLALAVIAFRFVRRRWGAASPATATVT
ncbi:MAG: hypothetical protein OXF79_18885 [Chloroflexi bacterium]|nr:hypothetical protein [Chloroflexota bacterium]